MLLLTQNVATEQDVRDAVGKSIAPIIQFAGWHPVQI
jgi:hypothetical protein